MEKKVKYSCLQSLKEAGAQIVVVATVREAEAIANACRDMGIVVSAFCDTEKRKTVDHFCGLDVIHTPNLPQRFPKARFIIASQHIVDVAEQLTELGYDEFYSALELFENYDVSKHQHLISQSYMESRISVYKKSHEAYFDEEKTYMRSVDVMVTTKCSLKCESCSNLMQYYVNPQNTDYEKTLEALDILHKNMDEISEFRIIGGEPLMNKDWAHIVKAIIDKNAERKIIIHTNGTIAPNDNQLELFHGKDVIFIITEYVKLSRNKDKLTEKLDQHGITYVSTPAQNWLDCSRIQHHKRTGPELEEVFKQCCVKYVYTLLDEKLYRCPFIANATNLKAIPDNPADYVDLFSKMQNIKQQLRRLVKVAKFFPACDFCDGRPYDPSSTLGYDGKGMIAAGRQTPKSLPYTLY
jgi:organic radical activating enzyme|tara:strand:+ start:266 stop:1495 length:1230 start_codon:yes stop_codon:yes gene_type:complete